MAVDPQKIADTKAWLVKAQRDLQAAKQLMEHDQPLLDAVAYHCQRCAEKSLKGFLFWYDTPFRKTHNLVELLAQSVAIDASLIGLESAALFLTPLATEFRYPSDVLEPLLEEAQEAYEQASSLLAEIINRLPKEAHPL